MDNICHTLVGVAAARAGLGHEDEPGDGDACDRIESAGHRRPRLYDGNPCGRPASRLDARCPRTSSLAHRVRRRDVDPGPGLGARTRGSRPGTRGSGLGLRTDTAANSHDLLWLLALSYLGVICHVFMDYLNTYGVRLLMPISNQWFYGDSVFIVDVWMWLMLGLGALVARGGRTWAARTALAATAVYVAAMMVSADRARATVKSRWAETVGAAPASMMVGPVPITPFRKAIIVDAGDRYVVGRFDWYPRHISFNPAEIPKNDQGPWVRVALAQEPDFAAILVWARFPYWRLEEDGNGIRVTLRDVRFPQNVRGFSATTYIRKEAHAGR